MTDDGDRRRALLRQLRDLDDDLAAGKLTESDHRRHRDPIEREAAALLRGTPERAHQDGGSGVRSAPARRSSGDGTAAPGRRRGIAVGVALAAAVTAVLLLLVGAVTPRQPGQTATGALPASSSSAPADPAGPAGRSGAAGPSAPADAADPAGPAAAERTPTPEQAAAIAAAAIAVKAHPKDVSRHLALAHAYADGGTAQLAAVEYLAILRLDPGHAEANTALALLAFQVGQTAQGKQLADRALATDPTYPEALYVRALILLMGLHQPKAAVRDLHAYLAAAPYGSHRTAADTLLALAGSQAGG
jgi:tetratricopeptide (TPR) repeat protein